MSPLPRLVLIIMAAGTVSPRSSIPWWDSRQAVKDNINRLFSLIGSIEAVAMAMVIRRSLVPFKRYLLPAMDLTRCLR